MMVCTKNRWHIPLQNRITWRNVSVERFVSFATSTSPPQASVFIQVSSNSEAKVNSFHIFRFRLQNVESFWRIDDLRFTFTAQGPNNCGNNNNNDNNVEQESPLKWHSSRQTGARPTTQKRLMTSNYTRTEKEKWLFVWNAFLSLTAFQYLVSAWGREHKKGNMIRTINWLPPSKSINGGQFWLSGVIGR